jgi:hypothetical protein
VELVFPAFGEGGFEFAGFPHLAAGFSERQPARAGGDAAWWCEEVEEPVSDGGDSADHAATN